MAHAPKVSFFSLLVGGDSLSLPAIGNPEAIGDRSHLDGFVKIDGTGSANGEHLVLGISVFSGYFPTVGEYLTFMVSGRVELKPNNGEGSTGQPATRSAPDSEGGEKPQADSKGRSR